MTIDSPWFVGTEETRRSTSLSPILSWMRPSCGRRFSAIDIVPLMTLRRAMIGGQQLLRVGVHLEQLAVDAVADAHRGLERLDVDVRGAHA